VQPLQSQMQNVEAGYPYKGRSKIPNRAEPLAPSVGARGSQRLQDQGCAAGLLASEEQAAYLADCSRYPYKGRLSDAQLAPTSERRQSFSSSTSQDLSSEAGKSTPCFGKLHLASKRFHAPSAHSTDAGSRITEVPLVVDDELLGIVYDDSSSESDNSSSRTPSRTARSVSPAPGDASLGSTESSACSTPRSDNMEPLTWQDAPSQRAGSSAASSTSGAATHPWRSAHAKKSTAVETLDGDLEAEVRELMMQYKIEKDRARPEDSKSQTRLPKEACGPELSSKSAWIHPDPLATEQV